MPEKLTEETPFSNYPIITSEKEKEKEEESLTAAAFAKQSALKEDFALRVKEGGDQHIIIENSILVAEQESTALNEKIPIVEEEEKLSKKKGEKKKEDGKSTKNKKKKKVQVRVVQKPDT